MLVSGLENSLLLQKVSVQGNNPDYTSAHEALCKCAKEILDRYAGKQGGNIKRGKKGDAAATLFSVLSSMPKDSSSGEMRDTISFALKAHAAVLQGYEHLLSTKGNTYALMQQTQGLRKGGKPASLLRYHDLKNKLLGPGSPLNDEQIKAMCDLDKNKSLALKTLETLEAHPDTTVADLIKLNETEMQASLINSLKSMTSSGMPKKETLEAMLIEDVWTPISDADSDLYDIPMEGLELSSDSSSSDEETQGSFSIFFHEQ